MHTDLRSLAEDGGLRVAINTGNRALVQQTNGDLTGISPALAERLAEEIGAKIEFVIYDGAGKVFKDASSKRWNVGFLAIDAARAETIGFTRPYVTIEATYAVRADSLFQTVEEVDRPNVTVLVAAGSAYDLYLSDRLEHAVIKRADTPLESMRAFSKGQGDAVAGVRQSLQGVLGDDASVRILPDAFRKVEQAMVLPDKRDPRLPALDDFIRRAIDDGFVSSVLRQGE